MAKQLDNDTKKRLGVLWVLLNMSNEYEHSAAEVVSVMNSIAAACPSAPSMWRGSFEIFVDGKSILNWRDGIRNSQP